MITCANVHSRGLEIDHLALHPGRIAVIGPNAGGKTRFLRLIAGIDVPARGIVAVDGRSPRECEIGWVDEFPDRNMLFSTVRDEIAGPLRFRHMKCTTIDACVERTATEAGVAHLLGKEMLSLSGGEKALVALATALACEPQVLVLDEFDSHIDWEAAERVQTLLGARRTMYLFWCTQDMDAAKESDTIVYIEKNRVKWHGNPHEVFQHLKSGCFYPLSWRLNNATSP